MPVGLVAVLRCCPGDSRTPNPLIIGLISSMMLVVARKPFISWVFAALLAFVAPASRGTLLVESRPVSRTDYRRWHGLHYSGRSVPSTTASQVQAPQRCDRHCQSDHNAVAPASHRTGRATALSPATAIRAPTTTATAPTTRYQGPSRQSPDLNMCASSHHPRSWSLQRRGLSSISRCPTGAVGVHSTLVSHQHKPSGPPRTEVNCDRLCNRGPLVSSC